jgi:L-arabinose isomerase
MKLTLEHHEVWFVTGSQHLYGEETLKQVAEHSKEIAAAFNSNSQIPVKVVFKPVLTSPDSIYQLCLDVNNTKKCRWHHCLDAHLLSGQNVDWRIESIAKTYGAFAYSIQ